MLILKKNYEKLKKLCESNQYVVCCGPEACGKTNLAEYICQNDSNAKIFNMRLCENIDLMSIAVTLHREVRTPEEHINYFNAYLDTNGNKTIIFDHIECCSAESFSLLVNIILNRQVEYKNIRVIGFYDQFALNAREDATSYAKIFSRTFQTFTIAPEYESLKDYRDLLFKDTDRRYDDEELAQLLKDANYNLTSIKDIINLPAFKKEICNSKDDFKRIRIMVLSRQIRSQLQVYDPRRRNVINQTATVGVEFDTRFVGMCFNIADIDAIIMEINERDPKLYHSIEDYIYSFNNQETRDCIYNFLTSEQKSEINSQIATYCYQKAYETNRLTERLSYLYRCFQHTKATDDCKQTYRIGCKVLKLYEALNDYVNLSAFCDQLRAYVDAEDRFYFNFYYAEILMLRDYYPEANETLEIVRATPSTIFSATAYQYLEYFQLRNRYLSPTTSIASRDVKDILDRLPVYDDNVLMFYIHSLAASIYDNSGDYKRSIKQEKSAKLYALQCVSKRYVNLLRTKVQMHAKVRDPLLELQKAIKFYQETNDEDFLAQTKHNYGSELLFQKKYQSAYSPLEDALQYFLKKGSVWSTYPLNNLAVLDILSHRYSIALEKLTRPFPCNTELFTVVTMVCNRMACYMKMGDMKKAEETYQELTHSVHEGKEAIDSIYIRVYEPLMHALLYYYLGDTDTAIAAMTQIVIPDHYNFLNQFIFLC